MAFPLMFSATLTSEYQRFVETDLGVAIGRIAFLIPVLFVAVLFLQSGIDKLMDRKGNLDWLKGHFANSPLRNSVPLLLTFVTMLELLTGISSLIGAIVYPFWEDGGILILFALLLSDITLLFLFSGQRIAKDYAGAAGIVPYFILSMLMTLVTILIL